MRLGGEAPPRRVSFRFERDEEGFPPRRVSFCFEHDREGEAPPLRVSFCFGCYEEGFPPLVAFPFILTASGREDTRENAKGLGVRGTPGFFFHFFNQFTNFFIF